MTTDGVRLGDLLTGAGLLQASDLREAMMISKQQGLPVGRVLIMSGYLTEQHLQAAVQAQSLLKDGLIEFDIVIKALTMVGAEDITLEEAFRRLKWNQQSDAVTNKLGELLLAAEIVPVDALNAALLQCQSIGLPLGRVLIGNGVLTEQMLAATLNAQVFIRDKKLTRDQAIQGLRSAKERQIPIEQYLAETGALSLPTAETVRLGELFVLAGIIDEPNLMGAVEVGLLNEQPIGQVLLQSSLISQEILDAALDLQAMVGAGAIKKEEAAKFLGTVKNKNVSVGEAIAIGHQKPSTKKKAAAATVIEEPPMPAIEPLPLYQFLQLSGMITAKDIEQAIRVGSKDTQIMAKMLKLSGVMESALVDAAEKCNDLIGAGVLNHEQGMIVLKNCERNNFTLEQAFNELGWNTAPLRSDPDVPELLMDTPERFSRNAYDTGNETTAQMSEAKTAESDALTISASDAHDADRTVESIPEAAIPAAAEPTSPFSQLGSADAAAPSINPLGPPPTAIEAPAAVAGGWPGPELAAANPLDSNPFVVQPVEPTARAEADALADFGSSINQLETTAPANPFAQPETPAPANPIAQPETIAPANPFAQPSFPSTPATPNVAEAVDPFASSGEAWQAASPDEWMPRPTSTAPEPASEATAQPFAQLPAQAPLAAPTAIPATESPATSDPWQAGGQAQISDAWQGGQAQHALPQAAPEPMPDLNLAAHIPTPTANEWHGGPAPKPQDSWSRPAVDAMPPQPGSPALTPPNWTPIQAPAQPASGQPAQGLQAPGPNPQPAQSVQPEGQSEWATTAPISPQAEWAASVPAQAAPAAPAQSDWASSTAPSPTAQPDWAAAPSTSAQPPAAAAQADWAAAPAPIQPAEPAQTDWAAASSQAQPPSAPAQTEWAAPPSVQPAQQTDWANSQAAAAAASPAEWQPPTSSTPQEAAWQGPPEPGLPSEWQPPQGAQPTVSPPQPPTAPVQPSWQSAAPSPLPGWQSTSTTSQDAWQPMPASPAAQMFQEAAQSLAGAPPAAGDGQQPPAAESAPQGPMDLFADSEDDHADPSDKPKKRLSDLMPKFGQKS